MSKIEWTNETWNPIIGCQKVSPGRKNCYAEKMAKRLCEINSTNYYKNVIFQHPLDVNYGKWNGETYFVESQLEKPLKRKKPTMYFVCSMGDLFHESVPFEWIEKVYDMMCCCHNHTFQILTKRPDRMLKFYEYLGKKIKKLGFDSIPSGSKNYLDYVGKIPNIWIGVTCENQEMANERIPILLQIPAKVRFVSVEPMLSAIYLTSLLGNAGSYYQVLKPVNAGDSSRTALDWVICGGESGHNARPVHPDWVRNLRDQCKAANVPFFFKQWGEWHESDLQENNGYKTHLWPGGKLMYKVGKKAAGRLLDGKIHNEYPKID